MGPTVNFEHEHMESLGLKSPLPKGAPVSFHGDGHVVTSGTVDGKHHMVVQLHKTKLKKKGVGDKLYQVDAGSGE